MPLIEGLFILPKIVYLSIIGLLRYIFDKGVNFVLFNCSYLACT